MPKTIYIDERGSHVGILADWIKDAHKGWAHGKIKMGREASYLTGLDLIRKVANNFDAADAQFSVSTAGRTQGIKRVNPASYLWSRKPRVEPGGDSYAVTWFDSAWLENDDQIYRPDYSVRLGRKVLNIKGRRVWQGPLASGPSPQPYYYWRFLEYGTIDTGYVMGEVQSGGQSYYFMTKTPNYDNPSIVFHENVPHPPHNCLSRVAGFGIAKELFDKYFAQVYETVGGGNFDALKKSGIATRFIGGGGDFALARENTYAGLPGWGTGQKTSEYMGFED